MAGPAKSAAIQYLFAHNAWATGTLLTFCGGLSQGQLAATSPGAVGSVFETLHHYVQAEGGYLTRLAPELRPAHWERYLARQFDAVRSRAMELGDLWEQYAASDPDAGTLCRVTWPDVTHEFPAGLEIVQAISHSYTHREQVCSILTSIGLQPPDLQGLAWGGQTGLLRRVR